MQKSRHTRQECQILLRFRALEQLRKRKPSCMKTHTDLLLACGRHIPGTSRLQCSVYIQPIHTVVGQWLFVFVKLKDGVFLQRMPNSNVLGQTFNIYLLIRRVVTVTTDVHFHSQPHGQFARITSGGSQHFWDASPADHCAGHLPRKQYLEHHINNGANAPWKK